MSEYMTKDEYMTKNVVLMTVDYNIVKETADVRGLGRKGFSAALRQIIREWKELTAPTPPDNGKPGEE